MRWWFAQGTATHREPQPHPLALQRPVNPRPNRRFRRSIEAWAGSTKLALHAFITRLVWQGWRRWRQAHATRRGERPRWRMIRGWAMHPMLDKWRRVSATERRSRREAELCFLEERGAAVFGAMGAMELSKGAPMSDYYHI